MTIQAFKIPLIRGVIRSSPITYLGTVYTVSELIKPGTLKYDFSDIVNMKKQMVKLF